MKKLIICVLCFATTHSFAQFRWGVTGAFSALNFAQEDGLNGLPTGAQTREIGGFQAGLIGEYELGYSGLSLQPAILYAENGSNFGNTQGFIDPAQYTISYSSSYMRIYSIRVPINLVYKFDIDSKWGVFAGVGPYIAKNLNGTEKGYYQAIDNNNNVLAFPINNTAKFSDKTSSGTQGIMNISGFDVGADFLLGFSYKRWEVSASYNRGFARVYHTTYTDAYNEFWNFSLSYMLFGHHRKPKVQ